MAFDPVAYVLKGGPVVSFIREASLISSLTPTQILKSLRASGLSIPTSSFYQVARYIRSQMKTGQSYVLSLPADVIPTPSQLGRTLTVRDRNYTYTIQVTGNDLETGELDTTYVTITSNSLLTKNQAIGIAAGMMETNQERYEISFGTAVVTDIRQNVGGVR